MRQNIIEENLRKTLLADGPFSQALFDYELAEHTEEYLQSKQNDGDLYFLAITEHTNDVAMLLIDEHDNIHINEQARALLKKLWSHAYQQNIQWLIPDIAGELDAGFLYNIGVTVCE